MCVRHLVTDFYCFLFLLTLKEVMLLSAERVSLTLSSLTDPNGQWTLQQSSFRSKGKNQDNQHDQENLLVFP